MVSQVLVVALAAFSIIISSEIFSVYAALHLTIHGKADYERFLAIPLPAKYQTPSRDQMKMMMSIYDDQQFKEGSLRFCVGVANGNRRVLIFPCEPRRGFETIPYSAERVQMFLELSPTNISGPIVICFLVFQKFILYRDNDESAIFFMGSSIDDQETDTWENSTDDQKTVYKYNSYEEETQNTECSIISKEMILPTFTEMIDDNESESLSSDMMQDSDSDSEPPTFSINNARSNVTIRIPNSNFSKMVMTMDDAFSFIQNLCPDEAVKFMKDHTYSKYKLNGVGFDNSSEIKVLTPEEERRNVLSYILNV